MRYLIIIALLGVGYIFFNLKVTPLKGKQSAKNESNSKTLKYSIPRVKWWQPYIVNGSKMSDTQRTQHMAKFIPVYEQKMTKLKRVVAKNNIKNNKQLSEIIDGIQFHLQSFMDVHEALKFTCKVDRKVMESQLKRIHTINNSVFSAVKGDCVKLEIRTH